MFFVLVLVGFCRGRVGCGATASSAPKVQIAGRRLDSMELLRFREEGPGVFEDLEGLARVL